MRISVLHALAALLLALWIGPASGLTLTPIAMGQVTSFGQTETWSGTGPSPLYPDYQLSNYSSYGMYSTTSNLTLYGNAGGDRYAPYWVSRYGWSIQAGWVAFAIPNFGDANALGASFSATYSGNCCVSINDLSPSSFGSAQALYTDVSSGSYARITPSGDNQSVTTGLGGNIVTDIFARQGDIFFLGLFGPGPDYTQPTAYLRNLSLNLTPSVVPIPAAAWLFGSAILGLLGFSARSRMKSAS
jgi:hypothetical protein